MHPYILPGIYAELRMLGVAYAIIRSEIADILTGVVKIGIWTKV